MAIDLLEQIHPHIKSSIYPMRMPIPDWRMKEGDVAEAASISFNDKSWTSIRVPFQWGKFDKTFWFRQTIKIMPQFAGKPLVLLLDFPEALLFLNGKPFHGIDRHHNEILICEKAKQDEQFVIAVQAYSGRKQESNKFGIAELAVLDTTARRLDSGLTILQELDRHVDHGSQESRDIRDLIHRTLIFLKYFKPGSEEYPNAIRRGYNFLLNTIETEMKATYPGLVHLIAHSHLDTAWLWTTRETARKCGRTFSTMLRLMEEFPEFKFSQSQPVLYDFTKTHYPDLYKQIKQRVLEGRWEPLGAMWTEADCNIPNGESLIRQILYGKRYFRQEFGIDSNILWLPDSFGFNWALPQILKKTGITRFYTSKLTWNEKTLFPYTSFWWQGIDKSKILVHMSPLDLEAQITPTDILKSGAPAMMEPPMSPVLQTFGYGDGGGGVTKENLEFSIILKTMTGLPASQLSTVREFFTQLEEQAETLPVWNNELYLETHRGTYTSQAWIKKENRQCENLLYSVELLSTLTMLFGKNAQVRKYPQQALEQAWKKLLLNQFHDILPGTAIEDVYNDARREYQEIRTCCSSTIDQCIQGISQPSKKKKGEFHFSLFNSLSWVRSEYIELFVKSAEKHLSVEDTEGKHIAHQVVERTNLGQTVLCFVEAIPALGFKSLVIRTQANPVEPVEAWNIFSHGIESPYYRARFDSKGSFRSLYAKHLRRELFQKGKRGNQFMAFHDTPKQWEAWNIDEDFEKHKIELWNLKQIKMIEQGPLRATVHLTFKSDNGSTLSQNIRFYHQSPRIDFQTDVRWLEKQVLMKVAFPFNMKASSASYEIPFGVMNRSSKPRTDWERAKFEVPAQQWADMSDAKYGVSVLNDCKYGYDAKENSLRLTVLRSPHYPNPIEPSLSDTALIDQGHHSFAYALHPHSGDWKKGGSIQQAREYNNPVLVFPNILVDNIPQIVLSSKPNIIIDSIKKSEESDAFIIRMHEGYGNATESLFQFGIDIANVLECNLLEDDEKQYKITKSKLFLKFKPFEIKTLKITAKKPKNKK